MVSRAVDPAAFISVTRMKDTPFGAHAFAAGVEIPMHLFIGRQAADRLERIRIDRARSMRWRCVQGALRGARRSMPTTSTRSAGLRGRPGYTERRAAQLQPVAGHRLGHLRRRRAAVTAMCSSIPSPSLTWRASAASCSTGCAVARRMVLHHPLDLPVFLRQIAERGRHIHDCTTGPAEHAAQAGAPALEGVDLSRLPLYCLRLGATVALDGARLRREVRHRSTSTCSARTRGICLVSGPARRARSRSNARSCSHASA
jgi:hypothetical protein